MGKGRPRKIGKRIKGGRLSRPAAVRARRVPGNDRAEAKKLLYGQDGVDAIGRAWRAGLLGDPTEAKRLVDTARALARAYRATFSHGQPRCALNQSHGGNGDGDSPDREKMLLRQLLLLDRRPPAFDELVLHDHPDEGPTWLDRIIFAKTRATRLPRNYRRTMEGHDGQRLRAAVDALAKLC